MPHYEESYSYKDDKSLRWYEGEEIEQFRNDKRFDEAFAFDRRYPDVLGVAALNEEGNIIFYMSPFVSMKKETYLNRMKNIMLQLRMRALMLKI